LLRPVPIRYPAVLLAVGVAQLLDLATFIPAVARVGIGAESNPLARLLYTSMGAGGPAALKATAVAIMLVGLVRVARRFPTLLLPSAALVAAIGLVGAASNLPFAFIR
jgi:hypothetical protein